MFTEESTYEIQQAFDHASAMQPAGEARLGELETNVLTGIVEQMAGGDDAGEVVEHWLTCLTPSPGNPKQMNVTFNGRMAVLRTYMIPTPLRSYCGAIQLKLEGFGYYLVGGGSDSFRYVDARQVVEAMFSCLQEDFACSTCGRLMIECGEVYCGVCKSHWNDKGCSVCGKRVGKLTDGVHEPCAKKPRKE
jgi:hypothetical protein